MFKRIGRIAAMDAATITEAALDALDEVGLDKLTMRTVARRLGVQVGGLYYHLPDKSALLRAMANEICRQALADFDARRSSGTDWSEAARLLCDAVRGAALGRRDAARVLAAGPLNGSLEALALMERLITVLEAGIDPASANDAADTLLSYVTGFVLQEQVQAAGAGLPAPFEDLQARFPRVMRAAGAGDDDRTFRHAVTAIIEGFEQLAPHS
jgi:TetR/AcrR family tetracycline transcriptional repressor